MHTPLVTALSETTCFCLPSPDPDKTGSERCEDAEDEDDVKYAKDVEDAEHVVSVSVSEKVVDEGFVDGAELVDDSSGGRPLEYTERQGDNDEGDCAPGATAPGRDGFTGISTAGNAESAPTATPGRHDELIR